MSRNRNKSNKKPVIDIVITTAGRFDLLEKCVDSLYREAQSVPLTISLVDIDTKVEDRNIHPDLFSYNPDKDPAHNVMSYDVTRFSSNVGFPMGANSGAKGGRAPLIMFIGDDVELGEGSIQEVITSFKDETVGVVGIRLMFPLDSQDLQHRPPGKIQHIGLALNIKGSPIHPLVGWSPDNPKTQYSRDCWAVTGACYSIRRDLFNRVGGFDVIYGRGTFEDCDLSLKVRQLGKRVYLNCKAYGYHYVGANAEKRKEGFPMQENLQIFQSRWGQSGLMVWDEWSYW